MKLGKKLREIRKENNLSVKNVSERFKEYDINTSEKLIYGWENDVAIPNLKNIRILSSIYKVNLSSLYEDSKYCKALDENENKFIEMIRSNYKFKKIVSLLLEI